MPPLPPAYFFAQQKEKKKTKEKKRKIFKAETIKRLSPRSKCYCFSHSRASRIQKFFFSPNHGGRQYLPVFKGPSSLKSILPGLWFAKFVLVKAYSYTNQHLSSLTLKLFSCNLIFFKELRNSDQKLFLCPPQKQAKMQPTF